ncbi:hypothetical protein RHMOL_Rhmol03G0285700 [Rhododendron molle]|uniref:Uncharacterized protein n=1 Tax=Rhododendron molle TaxID=49168 RepID=A0ACC0PM00_RHOML|nr:hypothetical protein RHMOL_Rhmol03G0285700 [Rhododendron molle]
MLFGISVDVSKDAFLRFKKPNGTGVSSVLHGLGYVGFDFGWSNSMVCDPDGDGSNWTNAKDMYGKSGCSSQMSQVFAALDIDACSAHNPSQTMVSPTAGNGPKINFMGPIIFSQVQTQYNYCEAELNSSKSSWQKLEHQSGCSSVVHSEELLNDLSISILTDAIVLIDALKGSSPVELCLEYLITFLRLRAIR